MLVNEIRVIIFTFNADLYKIISDGLLKVPEVEKIVPLKNTNELEANLLRGKTNALILDVDKEIFNHNFFNMLTEKHNLVVILTASSTLPAIPLLKGNIKDFVLKPGKAVLNNLYVKSIIDKIKSFYSGIPKLNYLTAQKTVSESEKIVAIGSSTGGTDALEKILRALPADAPPILIVQHITSGFTKFFADRLNTLCKIKVKEAENNDYLSKGLALIAPADMHMILVKHNQKLMVECFTGPKVNCVMPAADVLFESVASIMKSNAIGVILTGMGQDGAKGLLKMHLAGARTIGQDKETCVVYGMPKVAFDIGAVDVQRPLDKIADEIMSNTK